MADAANCRASEPSIEFVGAPGKEIDQVGVVQAIAHVKVIASRHLRKFIPRTDELTIIAAVDAIADERTQREWDASVQFDGQISNTFARVDAVRGHDGARRTGVHAARAMTAMRAILLRGA